MRHINIYIEGKGDMVFLSYYFSKIFGIHFSTDFHKLKCDYKSENLSVSILSFEPKTGQGGINSRKISDVIKLIKTADIPVGIESIIIMDCDTELHTDPKGGFNARNEYLKGHITDSDIKYFLIPNHKDDGNLESLLDGIISQTGSQFYACLSSYVTCLKNMSVNIPIGILELTDFNKVKLDWYTYIMLGKNGAKGRKSRDYGEEELWDLTAPSLEPLKSFLTEILK